MKRKSQPPRSCYHIENHVFGHNSAIFAHICTEFEIYAENTVEQTDLPSKLAYCKKSKMTITCQTTQGYKFFSKTANIIYRPKKLQTIYLMLYKRQIKKQQKSKVGL